MPATRPTGEELIRPLRELAPAMIDTCGTIPATELRDLHGDPEQPVPGLGDHALLRELPPEAVDALIDVAGHESGSPLLGVELRHVGGALKRTEPDSGALAALDAEYLLYGVGVPMTPELAQAIPERLRAVVEAVSPVGDRRQLPQLRRHAGRRGRAGVRRRHLRAPACRQA